MITPNKPYDLFPGTSQRNRALPELQPEHVKVDGRTLPDMLQFIRKYAELVNFFDEPTLKRGDRNFSKWGDFFNRDNLILVVGISNFGISEIETRAQSQLDKAFAITNQELRIDILRSVTEDILRIADAFNHSRKNLQRDNSVADLMFEISNAIQGELKDQLLRLYTHKNLLQWDQKTEDAFQEIGADWQAKFAEPAEGTAEVSERQLEEIKQIFYGFFFAIHHIIERAKELQHRLMRNMRNNKPHIALYIAFLRISEYAQKLQNELPQRHLDFYYREVLRQKELKALPDHAFVYFALAPDIQSFVLQEGTLVEGGKNSEGEDLRYFLPQPVRLTSSKLMQVCSVFKSLDRRNHQRPVPNFVTALFSTEKHRPEKGTFQFTNQPVFGEEQVLKTPRQRTMQDSRIGFRVSSPVLRLASGVRTVELELEFERKGFRDSLATLLHYSRQNKTGLEETVYRVFSTAFSMHVSLADGMLNIPQYGFSLDKKKYRWKFTIEFGLSDPPIAPFLGEQDKSPTSTEPFIDLFLRHECSLFLYSMVDGLNLKDIRIRTRSRGITDLKLFNNLGAISPQNPFELFGPFPKNKSYFLLGQEEAFAKKLDELKIRMHWYNLPILEGGMETYYEAYANERLDNGLKEPLDTDQYRLEPALLNGGSWTRATSNAQEWLLFDHERQRGIVLADTYSSDLHLDVDLKTLGFTPVPAGTPASLADGARYGFLRFDLHCPEFAFGQDAYANVLSDVTWKNSKLKKREEPIPTPKPPFTPVVDEIELEYRASASAVSGQGMPEPATEVTFHQFGPFGYRHVALRSADQSVPFLETDQHQGSLLLALDSYPTRGEISLLFQLTNAHGQNYGTISWSYLRDNTWIDFTDSAVTADSTMGFTTSGVIRLRIPDRIKPGNTIADSRWLWIKASISSRASDLGHIRGIWENGATTIWDEQANPLHIEHKLPAFAINRTTENIPQVESVIQPLHSAGGKKAEDSQGFYMRVSERLRHKNRAINVQDYEQMALEAFPQLFKAKCFTAWHTLSEDYKDVLVIPGTAHLAVIPRVELAANKLRPAFTNKRLLEVQDYLMKHVSPFVKVRVQNPFYEQVRVICKVNFTGFGSDALYQEQLQNDIINYLYPGQHAEGQEDNFGKSVFKSEVLAFIQQRDYVDFVTEFSMVRILAQHGRYDLADTARAAAGDGAEEIKPKYPWSILTSAPRHDITTVEYLNYEVPKQRGINNMRLGTDFILSDKT